MSLFNCFPSPPSVWYSCDCFLCSSMRSFPLSSHQNEQSKVLILHQMGSFIMCTVTNGRIQKGIHCCSWAQISSKFSLMRSWWWVLTTHYIQRMDWDANGSPREAAARLMVDAMAALTIFSLERKWVITITIYKTAPQLNVRNQTHALLLRPMRGRKKAVGWPQL